MEIRVAKAKDIEELSKLDLSLEKYEKKFDPLIRVGNKKDFKIWLKRKIKDKNFKIFVAVDKKRIIGFAYGWIEDKPDYSVKIGYLCDCFVEKSYRGKGVGKKLIKSLLKWFKSRGIKYGELDVYSKNKDALKFWQAFGFEEIEKKMRIKIS